MTQYTYKNQAQVRSAFFEEWPAFTRLPGKTQNDYPADVRMSFADFVDGLHRGGHISDKLAHRVTL